MIKTKLGEAWQAGSGFSLQWLVSPREDGRFGFGNAQCCCCEAIWVQESDESGASPVNQRLTIGAPLHGRGRRGMSRQRAWTGQR